ncbi:hypothetical protein EHRUM3_06320, partial [Ehrlichia ruminantium]
IIYFYQFIRISNLKEIKIEYIVLLLVY